MQRIFSSAYRSHGVPIDDNVYPKGLMELPPLKLKQYDAFFYQLNKRTRADSFASKVLNYISQYVDLPIGGGDVVGLFGMREISRGVG